MYGVTVDVVFLQLIGTSLTYAINKNGWMWPKVNGIVKHIMAKTQNLHVSTS